MQLTSSIDRTRSCRTLRKILERISPDGWRMFVVMAARFEKSPKYLQRTATARKHRDQRPSCGWKLPIIFSKKTICVLKRITHKLVPQTNKQKGDIEAVTCNVDMKWRWIGYKRPANNYGKKCQSSGGKRADPLGRPNILGSGIPPLIFQRHRNCWRWIREM